MVDLVTCIQKARRATRLEFNPDWPNPSVSFTAEYLEPFPLPEGREWGTWTVDGVEIQDPTRSMEGKWTVTASGHSIKLRISR